MNAGWVVVLAFFAAGLVCAALGVGFAFLQPSMPAVDPKPPAPERLTVDEQAIRTYVGQYLRDEIDVEELDRKVGWQLQVGPAPEPPVGLAGGRVTWGVRVDRPDWVRQAERAILESRPVPKRGEKK